MGPLADLRASVIDEIAEVFRQCSERYQEDKSGLDYKTPLFDFIRYCRSVPQLGHLDAFVALDRVQAIMKLKDLAFSDFECLDEIEGEIEFISTWDAVKIPAGSDPVTQAVHEAASLPDDALILPANTPSQLLAFLKIAVCLQRMNLDTSVALPVDRLGKELAISGMSVSRLRAVAERRGWIKKTHKHNHLLKKAALFRVHVELRSTESLV
jgi:hypothetical protein